MEKRAENPNTYEKNFFVERKVVGPRYTHPNGKTSRKVYTEFAPDEEPTLTQEQFGPETDVNNIIKKYRTIDEIPLHLRQTKTGVYGDFHQIPSYQEALHTVMAAENAFGELPADIRQRFQHDPQQLMDFLSDEKNLDESYKLGLRVKKPEPIPDPVLTELKTLNKNLTPKKKNTSEDE